MPSPGSLVQDYIPQEKDRTKPIGTPGSPSYSITFETVLSSVVLSTPVHRVPRIPTLNPDAQEWGVIEPVPVLVDFSDWDDNRDIFAVPFAIPDLTFSKGES